MNNHPSLGRHAIGFGLLLVSACTAAEETSQTEEKLREGRVIEAIPSATSAIKDGTKITSWLGKLSKIFGIAAYVVEDLVSNTKPIVSEFQEQSTLFERRLKNLVDKIPAQQAKDIDASFVALAKNNLNQAEYLALATWMTAAIKAVASSEQTAALEEALRQMKNDILKPQCWHSEGFF